MLIGIIGSIQVIVGIKIIVSEYYKEFASFSGDFGISYIFMYLLPTSCFSVLGVCKNILLCFSALSNGKKILNIDPTTSSALKCVHGMRFFSICWIIMVHTYLEVFAIADNKTMRVVTERHFLYQTISNATFSVDTFFFIRYVQEDKLISYSR